MIDLGARVKMSSEAVKYLEGEIILSEDEKCQHI